MVWTKHSIVAVNTSRYTGPNALAIVTVLNQAQAARESIVHSSTFALIEDSWVATIATSHRSVVFVLGQAISKTIANEDRLQVDIGLLVGEDLRSEDWDVVASIRFTSNMEVLLSIFWELLEEEGEESIYVLASSDGIAHL